jgi:hypothetical protein
MLLLLICLLASCSTPFRGESSQTSTPTPAPIPTGAPTGTLTAVPTLPVASPTPDAKECGAGPCFAATPTLPGPPTATGTPRSTGGTFVTVLATDVALWERPDTLASKVSVSFTINGKPTQTIVYVSGDVPVLEADVIGADGKTRWTRVSVSGHAGPQESSVAFTVTGYLRNDLISAPHPPITRVSPTP